MYPRPALPRVGAQALRAELPMPFPLHCPCQGARSQSERGACPSLWRWMCVFFCSPCQASYVAALIFNRLAHWTIQSETQIWKFHGPAGVLDRWRPRTWAFGQSMGASQVPTHCVRTSPPPLHSWDEPGPALGATPSISNSGPSFRTLRISGGSPQSCPHPTPKVFAHAHRHARVLRGRGGAWEWLCLSVRPGCSEAGFHRGAPDPLDRLGPHHWQAAQRACRVTCVGVCFLWIVAARVEVASPFARSWVSLRRRGVSASCGAHRLR